MNNFVNEMKLNSQTIPPWKLHKEFYRDSTPHATRRSRDLTWRANISLYKFYVTVIFTFLLLIDDREAKGISDGDIGGDYRLWSSATLKLLMRSGTEEKDRALKSYRRKGTDGKVKNKAKKWAMATFIYTWHHSNMISVE